MKGFKSSLILVLLAASVNAQTHSCSQKHQPAQGQTETIEYSSQKYGFCFTLPESWKGYSVLWTEWQGTVYATKDVLRGPKLIIRHPKWTHENPREDMPIMIFTIAQWNEGPNVSAAPFDPPELGRNHKYVFAVSPRWDYDFAEGYEEAEKILTPASLHTFAPEEK